MSKKKNFPLELIISCIEPRIPHYAEKPITLKTNVLLRVSTATKKLVICVTVYRVSLEILSKSIVVFLVHQIFTSNISQLGKMETSLATVTFNNCVCSRHLVVHRWKEREHFMHITVSFKICYTYGVIIREIAKLAHLT